jgi:Flp pilus assembly protein TadD
LFRRASQDNPQYGEAFVNLGLILASESRFSEAEQALRRAIEISPNRTTALSAEAMILMRLNRGDEAIGYLRKVSTLDPNSPNAHLNLGIALASAHGPDWPGAIAQLQEALKLCGTCGLGTELHKRLGLIYWHSGDLSGGRAELLKARKLSPDDEEVKKALAELPPQ